MKVKCPKCGAAVVITPKVIARLNCHLTPHPKCQAPKEREIKLYAMNF